MKNFRDALSEMSMMNTHQAHSLIIKHTRPGESLATHKPQIAERIRRAGGLKTVHILDHNSIRHESVSEDVEHEHMKQHMADKEYNVQGVKKLTMGGHTAHHVEINNLPEHNGMVPEDEIHKAQKHIDKLGSNYLVHTKQKIRTTVGGE
jgi:hypothetical protein